MLIQTLTPPVVGQPFRFSVAGCSGKTRVRVVANDEPILQREYDGMLCQSQVVIPFGVEGKTLNIVAIDSAGNTKTLEYEVSAEEPGPHSMLSFTR